MYIPNTLPLFILSIILFTGGIRGGTSVFYPNSISSSSGSHSNQAISVLSVQDQSGTQNTWSKYVEFDSMSAAYSGIFTFNIGSALSITGLSMNVNFLGMAAGDQRWNFDVLSAGSWVKIGDNSAVTSGWASWVLLSFTAPNTVNFAQLLNAQNQLQIRLTASNTVDNCDIDFMQLTLTTGSTVTTAAATTASSTTASSSTTSTTAKSSTSSSSSSSSTSSSSTSTAGSSTTASGSTTTSSTSSTSGGTAPTANFNLKMLILASSQTATGVDFVKLAFDTTGVAYDVVTVSGSTSLASYLSTSGTGKYAGIVSVSKNLLVASQQSAIIAYQLAYGVKWAIIGSNPSGLAGLSPGSTTSTKGTLTLAPEFSKYTYCMQSTASIDTASTINWSGRGTASVTPATVTNFNFATPAIMIKIGSQNPQVAAAQINNGDGALQLHYFVDQHADYFHSRAFAPLLVNWLSPGMVFQGARRINFLVQADDLFLASNKWDVNTHSNPQNDNSIYRMTAADLQGHADYYDALNQQLPEGSYVTVEWPFNGAGTTWYINPDTLFAKAIAIQNKFWFISHTFTHPCDFDTASYNSVNSELAQNIQFEPSLLTNGLRSARFSNDSLINPCITGLFNGNALRAMADNGLWNCVGDNSVANLVPPHKYHGITTTTSTHGYAGIFIVPRLATDIFYDCTIPAELVDEYNHMYGTSNSFEDIMQLQLNYALELQYAFRHDPYMFHQANGRMFSYNDPVAGGTHTYSLITLFTERVVKKVASMYNLPIMTPRMTDLVKQFKTRTTMDSCGFQATLQVSNGKITGLQATSTNSCTVGISGLTLSGSTVTMETSGPEKTAWIKMTAGVPQTLSLVTPISL